MGNKLIELMKTKEISLKDLSGKTLVVDAYNQLYMFLATIRGPDGTLLTDANGNVTSHLQGTFGRFTRLMKENIRCAFVFDGKPPSEKLAEQRRRAELKAEAMEKYEEAKEKEDIEEMKKYAARTSKLTKEMVEEAKKLISALGMPVIQAPSEGEAQAAHIVKKGSAYAVMSQDADSLVFEAPRLVKNLTITGRRKQRGAYSSNEISPELVDLKENLEELGVTQEQFVCMALLTGTDYNYGGIRGIGPKKALALAKKFPEPPDLFREAKWDEQYKEDNGWKKLFNLLKSPEVSDNYELKFSKINEAEVRRILVDDHSFSAERVDKTLSELKQMQPKEVSLQQWFGA